MRTRTTDSAATANPAAASRAAGSAPHWATMPPASSGPANVPTFSPSDSATFALTSSAGLTATAGMSASIVGRTSAPAAAATATAAKATGGYPAMTASATTAAPAARTRLAAMSARSGRAIAPVSTVMLRIVAGTMRMIPTRPTRSAPPAW